MIAHLQQAVPNDFTNFKVLETFLKTEGISFQEIRPGHGIDKANWLLTSATRGKYLVTGNGHAIGVVACRRQSRSYHFRFRRETIEGA